MAYCANCGNQVSDSAAFCTKCGASKATTMPATGARTTPAIRPDAVLAPPSQRAVVMVHQKSSGLAVVMSFFWSGLGQIYTGQIAKGVVMMIAYPILVWIGLGTIVGGGLMAAANPDANARAAGEDLALVGFMMVIGSVVLWVYGMVNAYRTAEHLNEDQLRRI